MQQLPGPEHVDASGEGALVVAEGDKLPVPGLLANAGNEALAAMAVSATAIGIGALFLELLFASLVGAPVGTVVGLPIPFVSTPLGAGAIIMSGLLWYDKPRYAWVPSIGAVLYWALVVLLWP